VIISEGLEEIIDHNFDVLDNGFVRVVDYMGNDASIVQAARVSYGSGTKKISEDRGLIRYLMRHRHTTPFEMCEIKLHVRVPMDCWRQWIRHRTASVNEYSTRYSFAIGSAYATEVCQWRFQNKDNKQGSGDYLDARVGTILSEQEKKLLEEAGSVYKYRIEQGVAREQARKDLPLSTYTEAYWKIDLHNLLHFLRLRMDSHAQCEIRAYANVIGKIVQKWCPLAWEAFEDYSLNSITLSSLESRIINSLAVGDIDGVYSIAIGAKLIDPDHKPRKNRERVEIEEKLEALGMRAPWK